MNECFEFTFIDEEPEILDFNFEFIEDPEPEIIEFTFIDPEPKIIEFNFEFLIDEEPEITKFTFLDEEIKQPIFKANKKGEIRTILLQITSNTIKATKTHWNACIKAKTSIQ